MPSRKVCYLLKENNMSTLVLRETLIFCTPPLPSLLRMNGILVLLLFWPEIWDPSIPQYEKKEKKQYLANIQMRMKIFIKGSAGAR